MEQAYNRNAFISLIISYAGCIAGLLGVNALNHYVIMKLPLATRMVSLITEYWLIAFVPMIVMFVSKDRLHDYGFEKDKIGIQLAIGAVLGIAMSLILTLIPHLVGFGNYVDGGKRYEYLWKFIYEFVYCIFAVGAVEEFVFRGLIYTKAKQIIQKDWFAVVISSVTFGLFHILSGSVVQMILTGLLGALFCLFRLKIKRCSTLSIIIAHGVYDALITVWTSLLL